MTDFTISHSALLVRRIYTHLSERRKQKERPLGFYTLTFSLLSFCPFSTQLQFHTFFIRILFHWFIICCSGDSIVTFSFQDLFDALLQIGERKKKTIGAGCTSGKHACFHHHARRFRLRLRIGLNGILRSWVRNTCNMHLCKCIWMGIIPWIHLKANICIESHN